jgi:hypothetical protein
MGTKTMTELPLAESGLFPASQEAAFTPEEEIEIQARLWSLLARQACLRTQGDHSSLREEDAAELLDSLVFTLQSHLLGRGLPMRALLTADLAELLKQGQAALQDCFSEAKALYETALQSVATFGSRSLADTLAGIGLFFRRYDIRLYAHHVPADIDYQLCLPVPETIRGVLFIRSYLERLLCENALIVRFAPARVAALLRRASPEYRDLLVNLYEPVAANVIGLSLLGGGETLLEINRVQADQIYHRLSALSPAEARRRLSEAAEAACRRLSVTDAKAAAYLSQAAETTIPRIVLSPQSASGVFSAR